MIHRWDIITIGNLSRNRYWGESEQQAYRPALCTCTLIRGDGLTLIVDPSIADLKQMATELDRRTGLNLDAINMAFITHAHGDHHAGLRHFAKARWFSSPSVAQAINSTAQYPRPVEPAGASLGNDIALLPTPGHTLDHHSLRFTCDGKSIVIAGDAVMTRDFFTDRRGFHNSADFAVASATITRLSTIADLIIPGHDNYFLTGR